MSDQLLPGEAEYRPNPQIGFHNRAVRIHRKMADRGKIIEVHIAVARRFELQLGPAELVVLHLQLDLVDLQLMHHALNFLRGHAVDLRP